MVATRPRTKKEPRQMTTPSEDSETVTLQDIWRVMNELKALLEDGFAKIGTQRLYRDECGRASLN